MPGMNILVTFIDKDITKGILIESTTLIDWRVSSKGMTRPESHNKAC